MLLVLSVVVPVVVVQQSLISSHMVPEAQERVGVALQLAVLDLEH